ncbi:Z1 domain-containing protein [Diaphorobacter caeni]|uniref:Z1 domain-containing protein n=1 Tax=Diaphorobacter caeni TaxID=2784387 RepID=UPI00188EDCC8|nr:Z1 domain-containing protein [Diaphorobacter caeni]MBF5005688.1 Z1 domain-containing protein [Diaphorobacter caeni]
MTELETQITSIAQILIRAKGPKPSAAAISDNVKLAAATMQLTPEAYDGEAIIAELMRRFSDSIASDSSLSDSKGHEDWFQPSMKSDWRYWQRLQRYMERSMSTTVVGALDRSTDNILAKLENPERAGPWDRRGLVVGHVQSGKTSSYSALICKAADAGYKIIIVLAGLHNNLRSQTQMRLEEAFLGYETSPHRDPGNPIGVFFEDQDPLIHPNCATSRDDKGDFNGAAARKFSVTPEQRPWLFVVKKNKSVLEKLLKWMRSNHVANATDAESGRRISTNLPILVIDDEADNASIDTGEQDFDAEGKADPEHEPKAINSLIRQILATFAKSAYVGYTATPFANVFIHRRGATKDEGEDLFPRSFIVNLAAPSNYVGPARVFGLTGPTGERIGTLPLIRKFSDQEGENRTGWMPAGHKKNHVPLFKGEDALPPSLENAILSFLMTYAVRICRGQKNKHCSMLIHVTRLTDVQNKVRAQVEQYVQRVTQRLTRGVDAEKLLTQLRDMWETDFEPTHAEMKNILGEEEITAALPTWEQVLKVLPDAAVDIAVKTINGSAKDALDYVEKEQTGLKVIAVGGDKLARGLTLEGLVVSYFVRTTKMYDTLMQMGRWFGYRPGYLDLCRLYTTADLITSFGLIADAAEELRQEFDEMMAIGSTPDKYGLKVASHPSLLVTSPMKMRRAQTINLSYSGALTQTINFPRAHGALQNNLDVTKTLIESMGPHAKAAPSQLRPDGPHNWKNSWLWKDIDASKVIEFLKAYSRVPKIDRANGSVIAEFIEKMNSKDELKKWTVALLAEGRENAHFRGYQIAKEYDISRLTNRKFLDSQTSAIGVLTDPADESIDTGLDEWQNALQASVDAWQKKGDSNSTKPTRPSNQSLRALRRRDRGEATHRGILLIYPISPFKLNDGTQTELNIEGWNKPIIGFAVSFPSSEHDVSVEYKVDHLLWEEQYGATD